MVGFSPQGSLNQLATQSVHPKGDSYRLQTLLGAAPHHRAATAHHPTLGDRGLLSQLPEGIILPTKEPPAFKMQLHQGGHKTLEETFLDHKVQVL